MFPVYIDYIFENCDANHLVRIKQWDGTPESFLEDASLLWEVTLSCQSVTWRLRTNEAPGWKPRKCPTYGALCDVSDAHATSPKFFPQWQWNATYQTPGSSLFHRPYQRPYVLVISLISDSQQWEPLMGVSRFVDCFLSHIV